MKNRKLVLLSFIAGVISISLFSQFQHTITKTEASVGNHTTSTSDTYYDSLDMNLSGTELLGAVHDLITSTHTTYPTYNDSGAGKYQQKTDLYYEGGVAQSGYLYEFYSGAKWPNAWAYNAGDTTGGYNREHLWCQSLSNTLWTDTESSTQGGGSDMHHIRPAEARLNSTRGNNRYGVVANHSGNEAYAEFGTNSTYAHAGWSSGVFEPLDSKKGDVARILLYVYVHYNDKSNEMFEGYATTNGSGSSSFFGELPLTNVVFTSNETEGSVLRLLSQWNALDPVDSIETRRNDQVAIYQGNRNPFIDHPELVDKIWGDIIANEKEEDATVYTYEKVNSISVGDTVHITCEDAGMEFYSFTSSSTTTYGSGLGYVNSELNGTLPLTVVNGSSSGSYAFQMKDGTYLNWISGQNSLNKSDTLSSTSSWKVSFDSSKNATISIANTSSRKIVYNVSYYRFATYNNPSIGSSYYAIQIYKRLDNSSSGDVTPEEPTLTNISMSQTSKTLEIGDTFTLTTTGNPGGISYSLNWSSSNTSVATVSNNGLVTAKAAGTTTITATVVGNTSIKATCVVTVNAATVEPETPVPSTSGELVIDDTHTTVSTLTSGKYIFVADANSKKIIFDPAKVTAGGKYAGKSVSSVTDDYVNYYATITISSSKAKILMDGQGSATHSNYYLKSPSNGTSFEAQSSSNNATSYSYKDNSNGGVLFYSGSRGIIYSISSSVYGNYATSNISNTSQYNVPHIYKVDTAYNFLVNKLKTMTCENMEDSTFNSRITYLFSKLSQDERDTLSVLNITCNDGKTYNAFEAYQYAINAYNTTSALKTLKLSNNIEHNSLLLVSICLIGFIAVSSVIIYKKRFRN